MRSLVIAVLAISISIILVPPLSAQTQPGVPNLGAQQTPGGYSQNDPGYSQAAIPWNGPAPTLTLPAGTLITVRLTDLVSSDRNRPGDGFTTVLDQPLVAQGWVVSRRGQSVMGRVVNAQRAGRVQGVSQLAVELSELSVVDGQQVPIRTQLMQASAGTSHAQDAVGLGGASGIGAIIGAAAGGGSGAAIGAAAGAAAGVIGVLSTRGRPTELYPETLLTFRLQDPIMVSTTQSQQAFRMVTPDDYSSGGVPAYQARSYRPPDSYPSPQPYPYAPYYYPGYYPPYGVMGYYGYYGFGPGIYFGYSPRVYIGHGYYHHHH